MLFEEKRIKTREQLRNVIEYEKQKYDGTSIASMIKRVFGLGENAILLKHQIVLRKAEYYTNTKQRVLSTFFRFRLTKIQNKYGIHIPLNCCEKGLRIMHVGSVLMNGNVSVGEDCSVHIGTALVASGHNDMAPVLGKGVVLGIGSVVIGDVNIDDYVVIGANAVVNKSTNESNIAIAGIPAKKVSNNGAQTWG